jgi:hypothetical protein
MDRARIAHALSGFGACHVGLTGTEGRLRSILHDQLDQTPGVLACPVASHGDAEVHTGGGASTHNPVAVDAHRALGSVPNEFSISSAAQCVVARYPRSNPAVPSANYPVWTLHTHVACRSRSFANSSISLSCNSFMFDLAPPPTSIAAGFDEESTNE